ncbi:MAG: hypothetical protein RL229_540 [Pseudomonadota bacterium]|jgi:hypothetical protein
MAKLLGIDLMRIRLKQNGGRGVTYLFSNT